ncbi:GGDEF domain-containing protein [Fervidobacterium sp.]
MEIEKAILDFVNSDYSIEWSREIYKIHLEPFGELVDILEESLRESTITKEILELTKLIYDEKLLMERLYNIFKELFDFDNIYICLSTYSEGSIYAFGNGRFANWQHVLDVTQILGYFTYYGYTEQKYLGESRTIDSFVTEILTKNDNPIVFVLVENPKIPEVALRTLSLSNYSLVQIFDLLNLYKILSSQKEIDETTGTYNCHVIQGKISNSIDFAMRNGLPLSFLRIKFNNLKDMYKTLGIVKTNQTLKSALNTLSEILSTEIGRLSMNEFIVILLGKTIEQVDACMDKTKNELLTNQNIKITHSIFEWNGQTTNEILEEL